MVNSPLVIWYCTAERGYLCEHRRSYETQNLKEVNAKVLLGITSLIRN